MALTCETIKVVRDNEDGYTVINKDDMKDTDKLFTPKQEKPARQESVKKDK